MVYLCFLSCWLPSYPVSYLMSFLFSVPLLSLGSRSSCSPLNNSWTSFFKKILLQIATLLESNTFSHWIAIDFCPLTQKVTDISYIFLSTFVHPFFQELLRVNESNNVSFITKLFIFKLWIILKFFTLLYYNVYR